MRPLSRPGPPKGDCPKGLSKRTDKCAHEKWWECECPWQASYDGDSRNLNVWWKLHAPEGHSPTLFHDKQTPPQRYEAGKRAFSYYKDAVDHGTVDNILVASGTFAQLVGKFKEAKVGITLKKCASGPRKGQMIEVLSGELPNGDPGESDHSVLNMLDHYVAKFGRHKLTDLERNPLAFESFLNELQVKRKWGHGDKRRARRTWNRYYQLGRRLCNWGVRKNLLKANPFLLNVEDFGLKSEGGNRERRIDVAHEAKVLEIFAAKTLNTLSSEWPHLSEEMERRWFGGTQLGLRAEEMLRIEVRHINRKPVLVTVAGVEQKVYEIAVPDSKGEKLSGEPQSVYAGAPEIVRIIEGRMFLPKDARVFGQQDGSPVESFDKAWHTLFEMAGMNPPREDGTPPPRYAEKGYIWHDLRHEYISRLVENGATEAELLKLARLESLKTAIRYVAARDKKVVTLATKVSG